MFHLKNWIGKPLKISGVKTLIVEGYPKAEDFKQLMETVEKRVLPLSQTDEKRENGGLRIR